MSLLVGVAVYATWLYRRALDPECRPMSRPDPTMEEIIDLRKRITAYQEDPRPDAELVLTAREMNYLVGDRDELHLQAQFVGSEVSALVSIPVEDGCYNIDYQGSVRVDDGVMELLPARLVVGEADLTWFGKRRTWRIVPEDGLDEQSAKLLENTERLRVENGQALVRLDNPWDIW